jgi:transposase
MTLSELEKENEQLRKDNEQIRKENEELRRENAGLREQLQKVLKEVEEWKRGHRERSKRRCSRPEGVPRPKRKRPGRKPGHPGAFRPVPKPDRVVNHPLPERCDCGGHLDPNGETVSTIVQDIPPVTLPENVKHVGPVGVCNRCGKLYYPPLPGAVRAGQSVAKVQIGPNAQALIISLRFEYRMPMQGIGAVMGEWFGLTITPGGVSQLLDRTRNWSTASYAEIQNRIRQSPVVGMDETGLRQDGATGWAWLARTPEASLFRLEPSRASWVAEAMLGEHFIGVLCTDFYGVYTARQDWTHAYCGAHVVREVKKIAEVSPNPLTIEFRDEIQSWYAAAKEVQIGSSKAARIRLCERLVEISARPGWESDDVLRICSRLDAHYDGITAFLFNPAICADNNGTERDIRCMAVFRKVTGGTRSTNGSKTVGHWMSVTQTLRKNGLPLRDYVIGMNQSHLSGRAPPSVFMRN